MQCKGGFSLKCGSGRSGCPWRRVGSRVYWRPSVWCDCLAVFSVARESNGVCCVRPAARWPLGMPPESAGLVECRVPGCLDFCPSPSQKIRLADPTQLRGPALHNREGFSRAGAAERSNRCTNTWVEFQQVTSPHISLISKTTGSNYVTCKSLPALTPSSVLPVGVTP